MIEVLLGLNAAAWFAVQFYRRRLAAEQDAHRDTRIARDVAESALASVQAEVNDLSAQVTLMNEGRIQFVASCNQQVAVIRDQFNRQVEALERDWREALMRADRLSEWPYANEVVRERVS